MKKIDQLKLRVLQKILQYRNVYFRSAYQLPAVGINSLCEKVLDIKPLIRDEICLPPYRGNKELKDYSTLITILKHLNPSLVLELGTAYGNTTANICAESDAKIITINASPEQITGKIITYTLSKDEIGYVYKKYGYENRITQVFENTKNLNVLEYVTEKSVDLAIIDACHDTDFVINDFLKILPSLSSRSFVIFHDTHPSLRIHYIDSYLGCMYLRKLGYNVKYIEDTSWAIWVASDAYVGHSTIKNVINRLEEIIERKVFENFDQNIKRTRKFIKSNTFDNNM